MILEILIFHQVLNKALSEEGEGSSQALGGLTGIAGEAGQRQSLKFTHISITPSYKVGAIFYLSIQVYPHIFKKVSRYPLLTKHMIHS